MLCSSMDDELSFTDEPVILGSWKRGERYAQSIIETMSHSVSSWIDWNMALDLTGGPSWCGTRVDSPIIVNSTADEFYKQPMFYVLGHFSKFVCHCSFVTQLITSMVKHLFRELPSYDLVNIYLYTYILSTNVFTIL